MRYRKILSEYYAICHSEIQYTVLALICGLFIIAGLTSEAA
jgi:hypothetical protein